MVDLEFISAKARRYFWYDEGPGGFRRRIFKLRTCPDMINLGLRSREKYICVLIGDYPRSEEGTWKRGKATRASEKLVKYPIVK